MNRIFRVWNNSMNNVATGTAHLSRANGAIVPINPQSNRPSVGHARPVAFQCQGRILRSHLRPDKAYCRRVILA